MALIKNALNINFSQGLDTKTDPWQVAAGKLLTLENAIFTKGGLLQKRNGFGSIASLPDATSTTLTTYSDNLIALGTSLNLYSQDSEQWINKGVTQPLTLNVIASVRTNSSQTTVDMATAANGLACAVWLDSDTHSYYQVVDSLTGQIIVSVTALPATAAMGRVFALGNYFIITFLATVTAASHLQYIAIPVNRPTSPGVATDLSTQAKNLSAGYDGVIANNNLYLAVDGIDGGGAIRITYLDSTLVQHSTVTIAGKTSNRMSVVADTSNSTPVIWVNFWNSGDNKGYSAAYSQSLVAILAPTLTINSIAINQLTGTAVNGTLTLFYENTNTYSYSPNAKSSFLSKVTCTQAGGVGSPSVVIRSVGLASKAFYFSENSKSYMLAVYGGAYQPTYFLIDSSGNVVAKLAYSNGGGYPINQILASVSASDNLFRIGYLFKDLLQPVNKGQGATNVSGIYSQTGINLAAITLNASGIITAEIGRDLHMTGGILSMYDGVKPVEHSFNVWPEDVGYSNATTGGGIHAALYNYQVTYEWTDAQGNIHRSAPSVPLVVDLTGSGSNDNIVTLKVPTLRLTYKTAPNPVRIVVYRWSTAQPIFYQVTSITSPSVNSTSVDSIDVADSLSDAQISGNLVLYTTGGVLENIAAPPCNTVSLYKSRLFAADAEDENLTWFSKQVIESVPVEMSNELTLFLAPTTGAQGSTGALKCLSAMDDKNIFFKKSAIYYNTGNGPDNTGANNDFSDPVFITGTVGSDNQESIVLIPRGLMFQSDKGIWLLGRDLSTSYIGAPVEAFNSARVLSAINIPAENQVRFTLDNGVTLMYDYYYDQWGTFINIPGISSVVYAGLHTYLASDGRVFQETPGKYLDGSSPVLLGFTTAWFNLMGLQGYQRAYEFYMLGRFISPHLLNVSVAYDYNPAPQHNSIITPDNYSAPYGSQDGPYGSSTPYGGPGDVEQWRIFFEQQRCEAFQITIREVFDPSFGTVAGAGLTMSGLNLVVGAKKKFPTLKAANSIG